MFEYPDDDHFSLDVMFQEIEQTLKSDDPLETKLQQIQDSVDRHTQERDA